MALANGIISAPVTIDDVKAAIGVSSNDLATLCKSKNINGWSKYKPLNVAKNFIDKLISVEEEWIDLYSITGYKGYVRGGMSIPWMNLDDINLLNDTNGNKGFEAYPNNLMEGDYWKYVSPKGGKYPYRLGDFRGYCADAIQSIQFNLPQFNNIEQIYNVSPKVELIMYKKMGNAGNSIQLEDIIPYLSNGGFQLGVYLKYKNGRYINGAYVRNELQILGTVKLQDYVYFKGNITPNYVNGGDEVVTIVAYFLYEKSVARYILLPWFPCGIKFYEMKRVIMVSEIKSGNNNWTTNRGELYGNVLWAKIGITKINETITIGNSSSRYYFRTKCTVGNSTLIANGVPITSNGSTVSSYTVPTGNGSDLYYVYISFSGVYDTGYYEQYKNNYIYVAVQFNETGDWKTVDTLSLKLMSL
nr:MAG TPA: hypothetical protein [Caudoviricetes sp.]